MTYYLVIDAGGTSCKVQLVAGDYEVLSEVHGGPSNFRINPQAVMQEIESTAQRALDRSGQTILLKDCYVGLGMAGIDSEKYRSILREWRHPFKLLTIHSDGYIACLGAHQGKNGAILILGTGSIGYVIKDGHAQRLGGWGFDLSDIGSGARIGREALRYSLLALEGITEGSPLTERILEHFNYDPAEMLVWAETALPKDYGAFTPWVFEASDQRDLVAIDFIDKAVREIMLLVRRLSKISDGAPIALLGGVTKRVEPWLHQSIKSLIIPAQRDSLYGAFLLAQQGKRLADKGGLDPVRPFLLKTGWKPVKSNLSLQERK